MNAVNDGPIDGGVIYHYYDLCTRGDSKNTQLHYFKAQESGAFISISGSGVVAVSKHKAQARIFIKWITGKIGQDTLRTHITFEYAVGVYAVSNEKQVPLNKSDTPKVEPLSLNSKTMAELMTEAGFSLSVPIYQTGITLSPVSKH
jgi:iron(III) transport system substrate-binding protein